MRRRGVFVGLLWLAVAAAATTAGVAAIDVLEDGITGSQERPLDGGAVRRALSQATTSTTPRPGPSTPPATPGGLTRNLAAGGGTVTARCVGDRAAIVAWTLAQGFRADDVSRGPAPTASLELKSDEDEYEVTVTCASGVPVAHAVKDDGHRRGRGGGDHD